MSAPFEADLDPETHAPRVRMNFANGWSISIVLLTGSKDRTRFHTASVAACPTREWCSGKTELLAREVDADEVADLTAAVKARAPAGSVQ